MTSPFATIANTVTRFTLMAFTGSPVTYKGTRGDVPFEITLTATRGQRRDQFQPLGSMPSNQEARRCPWLVVPSQLQLEGQPIEPTEGDQIVAPAADGATLLTYQVASDIGGPCWRWSDHTNTFYRIATILVDGPAIAP